MSAVFQEADLAGIKLKNRVLRSATHEGLANSYGRPMTEELMNHYVKLAQGGVGAIITGYVGVQQNGKTFVNMRMFDKDEYIETYQKITSKLKEYETPIIQQIAHSGGLTSTKITGETVVAPSTKLYPIHYSLAKKLTEDEIKQIIKNFVDAIVRTKKAGFDGVQLHAAHGYLLCEFLSPNLNRRSDSWGGNIANRVRIIEEIVYQAREKVGNYPILVKLSAYDAEKNGMRLEEAIKIAQKFQTFGIDAIEVSCGAGKDSFNIARVPKAPMEAALELMPGYNTLPLPIKKLFTIAGPLMMKKYSPLDNYNVNAAAEIKRNVDIPVIVVGGIRKLVDMEQILTENKADFVSMCRPFIIEPDILNKLKSGTQSQSRCIDCGYCILGIMGNQVKCYYGKI